MTTFCIIGYSLGHYIKFIMLLLTIYMISFNINSSIFNLVIDYMYKNKTLKIDKSIITITNSVFSLMITVILGILLAVYRFFSKLKIR